MKSYKFKKIDAFTEGKSSGNPAGVVYLDSIEDITTEGMQKIAKELKGFVNEVGYIYPLDEDYFNLKYYSSEREVDLCGHATIAIMHDLIKTSPELLKKDTIYINTSKGKLSVFNRIHTENSVFITAPKPVFSDRNVQWPAIAKALRVDERILDTTLPISIVNAGLETLLVPIQRLEDILSITPNLVELKEFCISQSIDIITVFTKEVSNKDSDYRTRVFAPTFGYLEDPATGSGNSAFGYYANKNQIWQGSLMTIEQNGSLDNFNTVKLEFTRDEHDEVQVSFGGGAVVRIEGVYHLAL
ncbi:MAG: PhzF family phenazine biosynthesis protein [Clostridia bacterium]|nr:PhzF family phenazine biosynthesis protein [Clostridia bacterium]